MQLIFLHGGKNQRFPQVDTIVFDWCGQHAQNNQNDKLAIC